MKKKRMEKYLQVKQYFILFILIGLSCLLGCTSSPRKSESNFNFTIDKIDLDILTSKRKGGKFYVFFDTDSTLPSDTVDYIEFKTGDSNINIIINPFYRDSIFILNQALILNKNEKKLNLKIIDSKEFQSYFYERQIKDQPRKLKSPYIFVSIISATYTINIHYDSINCKTIKGGDIFRGW